MILLEFLLGFPIGFLAMDWYLGPEDY